MLNFWYYMTMLRNPYYLIGTIFVLLAALLAMYAQTKVQLSYKRYKQVRNKRGLTGAQVAREILDSHGMRDIPVNQVSGTLSDHFDPTRRTINLSQEIYSGTSIASVAVAAHECGHAIQHHERYKALIMRNAILPIANIGNYLGWFAIMIGLVLGNTKMAWIGLFMTLGILLFQIITLPVEFDASKRGLQILKAQYLYEDEYKGASSVLSAAALTYVAAVISTLASMLRILLVILGNSRDS